MTTWTWCPGTERDRCGVEAGCDDCQLYHEWARAAARWRRGLKRERAADDDSALDLIRAEAARVAARGGDPDTDPLVTRLRDDYRAAHSSAARRERYRRIFELAEEWRHEQG